MIVVTFLNYEQIRINQRTFFVSVITLTGLAYLLYDFEISTLYFIIGVLLAAVITIYGIRDPVLRNILLVALLFRFMLALIQAYSGINLPLAGADSVTYIKFGWEYAQAWQAGSYTLQVPDAYLYYSALIGLIYVIFGKTSIIVIMLNVLFGVLIVYFVYLISNNLSDSRRVSLFAAMLTALFPALNLLSAVILRENLMILLSVLSFFFFLQWLKHGNFFFIAGSFLSTITMALFHGAMLFVNWIQYFYFSFFSPKENRFRFTVRKLMVIGFLLAIVFVMLNTNIIAYKVSENLPNLISLKSFQSMVDNRSFGRTHYLEGLIPTSYFDILWHTPIRALYFMFTPFPWMIETTGDLLVFLESLIYLVLVFFSLYGFKNLIKKNRIASIGIAFIVMSIVILFAWGTVNFGTAWRHRAKTAPFLIVLASAGIAANPHFKWLSQQNEEDFTRLG